MASTGCRTETGRKAERGSSRAGPTFGTPTAVRQSSGGITAAPGPTQSSSIPGHLEVALTFPQDLTNCVAVASASENPGTTAPVVPVQTRIDGARVTVTADSPSGIFAGFSVVVTC